MEVTKEMLTRHNLAQKCAQDVTNALDGLTIVEALGVIELVKSGMLKYLDTEEYVDTKH